METACKTVMKTLSFITIRQATNIFSHIYLQIKKIKTSEKCKQNPFNSLTLENTFAPNLALIEHCLVSALKQSV